MRTDIERLEHCVYCGASSSTGWYTEEQEAYILAVACEQGVDPLLEEFGCELGQIKGSGSCIVQCGFPEDGCATEAH